MAHLQKGSCRWSDSRGGWDYSNEPTPYVTSGPKSEWRVESHSEFHSLWVGRDSRFPSKETLSFTSTESVFEQLPEDGYLSSVQRSTVIVLLLIKQQLDIVHCALRTSPRMCVFIHMSTGNQLHFLFHKPPQIRLNPQPQLRSWRRKLIWFSL